MSIFSETMIKAVADYRLLLRRYLTQSERMAKLRALKLRDLSITDNDLTLYQAGKAIIEDIERNMAVPNQGYYSYSGISQFCQYLTEYLDNYHIENDQVVHRAQKASRALIISAGKNTIKHGPQDDRYFENSAPVHQEPQDPADGGK